MVLNFDLVRQIHYLFMNGRYWVMQHISKEFNRIIDCIVKITFNTR